MVYLYSAYDINLHTTIPHILVRITLMDWLHDDLPPLVFAHWEDTVTSTSRIPSRSYLLPTTTTGIWMGEINGWTDQSIITIMYYMRNSVIDTVITYNYGKD